jgi:hypothetical protein
VFRRERVGSWIRGRARLVGEARPAGCGWGGDMRDGKLGFVRTSVPVLAEGDKLGGSLWFCLRVVWMCAGWQDGYIEDVV